MPCSTPMSRMFSRMSPFRMWLNSCAMTPCSSSRVKRARSRPRVTAITASLRRVAGREGVDPGLVVQDVDGRHGNPGRDRHLLDHVQQPALQRIDRPGVHTSASEELGDGGTALAQLGRPEGGSAPDHQEHADRYRGEQGRIEERARADLHARLGSAHAHRHHDRQVHAHDHERDREHVENDQPAGEASRPPLRLEEIHGLGRARGRQPKEIRGASRSSSLSISKNSASSNRNEFATMFVGTVCLAVLYVMTASLNA